MQGIKHLFVAQNCSQQYGQSENFLLARGGTKRKYHLIKWTRIYKSKTGGLGIKDRRKWWWKLEQQDEIWQGIVKAMYIKEQSIHTVSHKHDNSSIWADLLKIKTLTFKDSGNGKKTRFWKDPWLYEEPLCGKFHTLFQLCEQQDITVAKWMELNLQLSITR